MLPPALLPAVGSPPMNSFNPSSSLLQRTPTNTSSPDLIAYANNSNNNSTASSPNRTLHHGGVSNPSLHHSPRLRHTGGVISRPRANTDYNVRSRYHHHSQHPYSGPRSRGGAVTMFEYSNETTGSYQTPSISYTNGNTWGTLSGNGSPNMVSNSVSSSPQFGDINMIEERKPSIGLNGSPHPPLPTLLPGPPASPSLSSQSRDSPGSLHHHLSGDNYNSQCPFPSNNVNSTLRPGDYSLPTVPSSSSDLSDHAHYGGSAYLDHTYMNGHSQMDNALVGPRTPEDYENQIAVLKNQLREMDFLRRQDQAKLAELQTGQEIEQQMTRDVDAQFKASWKSRTESRIKTLCALNRAGNALCAWHDSRRERRQYPPRMAPAGVLNCGCTYEQALFEESLTRQGVGAYQPGESVRMDPALRNPLLNLLQRRYGYRDGDFERVRVETTEGDETWLWPENDDAKAWSTGKAQVGNMANGRRAGH